MTVRETLYLVAGEKSLRQAKALAVLKAADERQLGLAVTSTNPARHVYERLGFLRVDEYWILALPEPA